MPTKAFWPSIILSDEAGNPHDINSIASAIGFLDGFPSEKRGPIFETARRACGAAIGGSYPTHDACDALEAWARSARIHTEVIVTR